MTADPVEYPPPVPARAAIDRPMQFERARQRRRSIIANVTVAAGVTVIFSALAWYALGGAP